VARSNFAAAVAEGRLHSDGKAPDLAGLAERYAISREPVASLRFFAELLGGRAVDPPAAEAVWRHAGETGSEEGRLNRAVALLLARPECQLV
jgi:hypothetical protein